MKPQDLRGAARLATEATAGLTDLVEAMHERIARVPGLAGALDGRTTGITGLVYRSIRGVTRVAGGTVDALLGLLAPALSADEPAAPPKPEREALVAALNGVLGDHLAATNNPLAITMALRVEGRALPLQREALAAALQASGNAPRPTLLVLLHGLCMNDLQWQHKNAAGSQDHGALLAPALNATPLYLHANTGLPIADNGRQFAALMQQLVEAWPVPVQRVVLLGHSMGGLIARSALSHAQTQAESHPWATLCSDLVCLGSPHHGAPLERAGHGVDLLLGAAPFTSRYTAPLARLGRLRSAGITDLRHGLRDEAGGAIPLPGGPAAPRCWALAGTLDAAADDPGRTLKKRALGKALGDGLVPLASALGRHADAAQTLAFAPERQGVLHGTGHLDLLSSPAAAAQLRLWLVPASTPGPGPDPG